MPNFITDPQLDPYMIQIDESNYAVVKNVTADSGKVYQQTLGFFSKLGPAIKKIAKDDLSSKDYSSLAEYVAEFNQIEERLNNIVNL